MKKLLFFLLLFYLNDLCAQEIEWGPVFANSNAKSKRMWLTAEDSTNIYLVKWRYFMAHNHWYLEAINKRSKNVTFSTEIPQPLDENKRITSFYSFITMGDKAYLLTVGVDKTEKRTTLYASSVNKSKGIIGGIRPIYSTSQAKTEREIKFSFSPDGASILFYSSPYNPDEDEMKVCNSDLLEIWKGPMKLNDKLHTYNRFMVCLDNKQNILVYSGELHSVSVYSTKSGKGKSFQMLLPQGTEIYNSILKIAPSGQAYMLSMLKPDKFEITSGLIHAFIDPEKQELGVTKTVLLDTSQLKELLGKHKGAKWQEMGLYYIKEIFFRNKDFILIGEQEYDKRTFQPVYYSSLNPPLNGNSYLGNYYYTNFRNYTVEHQVNLISVFEVSYEGDLNWVKIIPKNQAHFVNPYLSFVATFDESNVYMVYNDDPSNVNAVTDLGPRAMRNPKRALGVLATINQDGLLKIKSFYSRRGNKRRILKPAFCYTGKNSLILFTESKKKACIGEFFLK